MSDVFFIPVDARGPPGLADRLPGLVERCGLSGIVVENDLVALKVHFGEPGNPNYVKPFMIRPVVEKVKEAGGKPFLTDAGTLYVGRRDDAVDHLETVHEHGFSIAKVGAPTVIADGLNGRDFVEVPYDGKHFNSLKVASVAVHCDAMMVLSHFKGHIVSGFGGAFKNVGMGLGSRGGKQQMHSDLKPQVTEGKCVGCLRCFRYCPAGAIVAYDVETNEEVEIESPTSSAERSRLKALGVSGGHVLREHIRSHIDHKKCIGCGECVVSCHFGAIEINWKTDNKVFLEKMAEYAHGIVRRLDGKILYLNYIIDVTPHCDCLNEDHAPIVDDVGIIASKDPVAVDQAAMDLVNEQPGSHESDLKSAFLPGEDKFMDLHNVDSTHILQYAQNLGMGSREYKLIQL